MYIYKACYIFLTAKHATRKIAVQPTLEPHLNNCTENKEMGMSGVGRSETAKEILR